MKFILQPWPWYVSGPLIALVLFLLLFVGKNFGMSSNLRTLCTICGADKKSDFFKFNWKSQRWNLVVMIGAIIGGFIGANFLTDTTAVTINPDTVEHLQQLGFSSAGNAYLPTELYSLDALTDIKSIVILAVGGLLVGFGTRYAGGCTSGHAISGLSNLQLPSLIAVMGFFIGGLFMIHVLYPLIF
ncbi:YeeE/YedE family protein [Cellulophaga omnivescoria]|uniref:YeeE/YedE family protein n=1 Tax=Cellulophaga omnivescoria TaxID=1888890 RepID=UPI0022F1104F|nr:YeeE/YedE thiosulfate transporter family protein [Cellulophaga omnivescoria]WBU89389.1 YeeE/YedE thiosulfate transporter family protein [Cellulophaga omnivescoria]